MHIHSDEATYLLGLKVTSVPASGSCLLKPPPALDECMGVIGPIWGGGASDPEV